MAHKIAENHFSLLPGEHVTLEVNKCCVVVVFDLDELLPDPIRLASKHPLVSTLKVDH